MGDGGQIKPFKNQVWEELRHEYNSENLFEDPEFPTVNRSMFFTKSPPRGVTWKRPKDAIRNPQFCVGKFDRSDLDQGYLGNCWFIAGCVGIMQSQHCFAKVVPTDQGFDDNYGGIFHFRFWLYDEWVDVVIDDRLPFWPDGRLVFCSNKEQSNELWGPLLEKAYSKLYGSYEALEGGFTCDALIDMSGGIQETFDLTKMNRNEKQELWSILLQAFNKNSILGCSINPDQSVKEARMSNGLVKGHAYTITRVARVNVSGDDVFLIRCRNPWGNEVEWNGAWSDSSREWRSVPENVRDDLHLNVERDGEFWMNFNDFASNWHTVEICHLTAGSFSAELQEDNFSWRELSIDTDKCWKCTTYHSAWVAGSTAGGCGQPNMAKFWSNPQFSITLTDVDKDDEQSMATVIVALMQKDSRLKREQTGGESAEEFIQFRIYKIRDGVSIDENRSTNLKLYSNQLERIGTSGSYINCREVTKRFRVAPGHYLIIPSTYEEDKESKFMLRIYTESLIENSALETDKQDLTEGDIFFEPDQLDTIFSNWNNLIGEDPSEEPSEHHGSGGGRRISASEPHDVKEACELM